MKDIKFYKEMQNADISVLEEKLDAASKNCSPSELRVGDLVSFFYRDSPYPYTAIVAQTPKTNSGYYIAAGTANQLLTAYAKPFSQAVDKFSDIVEKLYKEGIGLITKLVQITYVPQKTRAKQTQFKKLKALGRMGMAFQGLEGGDVMANRQFVPRVKEKNPTVAEELGAENFKTFIVTEIDRYTCKRLR